MLQASDYQKDIIQPAVKGTTGILYSAKKFPSVRRIVITSSLAALIPYEYYFTKDFSKVFTGKHQSTPSHNFHYPLCPDASSKLIINRRRQLPRSPGPEILEPPPRLLCQQGHSPPSHQSLHNNGKAAFRHRQHIGCLFHRSGRGCQDIR